MLPQNRRPILVMTTPRVLGSSLIALLISVSPGLTQTPPAAPAKPIRTFPAELVKAGETLFVQHCAFCHGRDTGGGESGPDLTRSKIVADDVDGSDLLLLADLLLHVASHGRGRVGDRESLADGTAQE